MGSISINDAKIIGGFKSITASTTLAPPCDMNLSLDTANITLTLDSGAFIGQKLSVVANATSSLVYTGVNGTTTEGLASGKKAILTWTGSHWLCSVSVVIQGKNATGTAFQYSGGLSVEAVPTAFKVISINESIIHPFGFDKIILKINQENAEVTLGNGEQLYKKFTLINAGQYTCSVIYVDYSGPHTDYIFAGDSVNYTWMGTYWTSSNMLVGKELDKRWNRITNSHYPISSDEEVDPIGEMSFVFLSSGHEVTLDAGKYLGQKVTFFCPSGIAKGAVIFDSLQGANSKEYIFAGQTAEFIWDVTCWRHRKTGLGPIHVVNNEASGITLDYINYRVKNGICTAYFYSVKDPNSSGQSKVITSKLPANANWLHIILQAGVASAYVNQTDSQYGKVTFASSNNFSWYWFFTYLVQDSWLEPNA